MPLSSALLPGLPGQTSFPSVSSITLAGVLFPGKWTLMRAPKKFGWQIQKGYGLSGAFVLPIGDELVLPVFKGEFWSMTDFQIYKSVRKMLLQKSVFSPPGGAGALIAMAMGIDHPELKDLGVTSVVVGQVEPVVQEPESGGLWTTTVEFIQYRPPILAPPRPKGAIPDSPKLTPKALTDADVEKQQLTAKLQVLQGKL